MVFCGPDLGQDRILGQQVSSVCRTSATSNDSFSFALSVGIKYALGVND